MVDPVISDKTVSGDLENVVAMVEGERLTQNRARV